MRMLGKIVTLAAVAAAMTACSGSSATPVSSAAPVKSDAPVASAAPASPAAATALQVSYGENCQVEFIAPDGRRIVVDLADPTVLTSPLKSTDIVLITHLHSDHYNAAAVDPATGPKIVNESKAINVGDIKITSIAASHDDQPVNLTEPTNHIFIIELDGYKIVHLGSTGQTALTADQLAAIGTGVDILAAPLVSVGGLDPNNDKAINVINQIKPKLVIVTHSSLTYLQAAAKQFDTAWSDAQLVSIPKDKLPTAKTKILCLGTLAVSYGAVLNAPEWKQ